MRDRLIELLKEAHESWLRYVDDCAFNQMALSFTFEQMFGDHLIANGVIVPPCKVGDTLWVQWSLSKGRKNNIYPVKVYALRYDTKKNNMRICVEGCFEITAYGGNYTHYYNGTFAWNSVGKSIFLTKEEAEQALAKMKGGAE